MLFCFDDVNSSLSCVRVALEHRTDGWQIGRRKLQGKRGTERDKGKGAKGITTMSEDATRGAPGTTTSNKKLLVTSASLLVTSATLVVTGALLLVTRSY